MMKERVLAWYNKTKKDPKLKNEPWKKRLPEHVLFYRDGVSESQYGMVLFEEKDQILDGCQEAFKELRRDKNNRIKTSDKWAPKLTLLVVTKRHHARFFPSKEVTAGDKKVDINLTLGQVIETTVVDPVNQDFYLQSHHSALGTARSSHYVVIHNDSKYDLLELQQIVSRTNLTCLNHSHQLITCRRTPSVT
jgi:eukaryotic translation initiation factor 2C